MVSTLVKRASLDDAYDAAVTAGITLRAQLRLYETAARATISSGQIISSVSQSNAAGARSTNFSLPDRELLEGMTPVGILEMWRELVDLNDTAVGYLGVTDDTTNRLAIKNEMMGLLAPVRELLPSSFTALRYCA